MSPADGFETHVTVEVSDEARLQSLRTWSERNGMKCLLIELSRGRSVSQPMVTWRDSGTLGQQVERARGVCADLTRDGFPILRLKIECSANSIEVPFEGTPNPAGYFEHHIKLLLPPDTDIVQLTRIAEGHGAHLSRNAFRRRDDGQHERFVTQRCRHVDRAEARLRLEHLHAGISAAGYHIIDVEEEFVVHDSNESLDAGWLPE